MSALCWRTKVRGLIRGSVSGPVVGVFQLAEVSPHFNNLLSTSWGHIVMNICFNSVITGMRWLESGLSELESGTRSLMSITVS